ncbi:hypothetical protein [Microbacterium marmarense]|uniref:Uncharacterized protein n=1 Tax=Microbacterium marmarense TaxID=3122051 RepID=A0ABU8LUY3_9MICO
MRLRRGIYVDSAWWLTLQPAQRYRERVRAASLSLDNPIFALESAAAVHGLPVFGTPRIHLHSPTARGSYRHSDVTVHASVDGREVVRVDGVRATSVLDTTVDLIRVLPLALAVAVVDAAIDRGVTLIAMQERIDSQKNQRGVRNARAALELADARSESVLESISRVVITYLGYEQPELQIAFTLEERTSRVDFFWRSVNIVGEADGEAKHHGGYAPTEQTIRQERAREVSLLRVTHRVARWGWADVWHPRGLDRILSGAGVPRLRPAEPAIDSILRNARTTAR